jgi:hypothetical protein
MTSRVSGHERRQSAPYTSADRDGKHFPFFPSLPGTPCDQEVAISLFYKEDLLVSEVEDSSSGVENNFPHEADLSANCGNSEQSGEKLQ